MWSHDFCLSLTVLVWLGHWISCTWITGPRGHWKCSSHLIYCQSTRECLLFFCEVGCFILHPTLISSRRTFFPPVESALESLFRMTRTTSKPLFATLAQPQKWLLRSMFSFLSCPRNRGSSRIRTHRAPAEPVHQSSYIGVESTSIPDHLLQSRGGLGIR